MSSPADAVLVNFKPPVRSKTVYANIGAAEEISEGMALCYDSDNATVAKRLYYVEKPTLANLGDYAGFVAPGQHRTGPGPIDIVDWGGVLDRGVSVYTDESIAAGDFLAPIPETYAFGKCVVGIPVFRATETVDRSTTAGLVIGDSGVSYETYPAFQQKRVRHFDDFIGQTTVAAAVANAVADQTTYLLVGTTATCAYADSGGPEAAAALQAKGLLIITPTTTTQANLTMNGEPFRLDSGKSAFFRARLCMSSVAADTDVFFGLSLTDTAFLASKPTDYIGFLLEDNAAKFEYVKDGATGVVTSASLATIVADTHNEYAFLIRNRGAGGMSLSVWIDGVVKTVTLTSTEIVDNESLTFVIETLGSAARVIKLDRVEICNYAA